MGETMNIAVIFAGGVGSRMHSKDLPKQFLCIHGVPIIVRTVQHFQEHSMIDAIVVVSGAEWLNYCRGLLDASHMTKVAAVVPGGSTGQESIFQGLLAAEKIADGKRSVVLIHDGVRPLINAQLITDIIKSVEATGSAVTCVRAKETVLVEGAGGAVDSIPDRSNLRLARAPQSFWLDQILAAHRDADAAGKHDYIDSASMMFERGCSLTSIEGPDENIKVTTPGDFFSLQAILNARENEQIYGI